MKKKLVYNILVVISLFMIVGCSYKNTDNKNINDMTTENNDKLSDLDGVISVVRAIIDRKEYTINLEDNETAKSFVSLLPQEYSMSELNGNEKYVYIENALKTNSYNPKHINAGDVMLYGNNCLVIFYKSFDTTYSYSKIGHIDNLPNLGDSNIIVKFEK